MLQVKGRLFLILKVCKTYGMFRLTLLILISSFQTYASNFDLSVGFQGRSFPGGGAIAQAEMGYNQLLWDKRTDSKKDMWKFGLLRPYIFGGSSIVINQFEAGVDLYPISILSFGVGRRYDRSDFDFGFFDCDNRVACQNSYERNFIRAKLVFALKGWVMFHIWRKENITADSKLFRIGEYMTVIEGAPGRDQLTTLQSLLGYQSDKKISGFLLLHSEMERTNQYSNGFFAVHQRPIWRNWNLMMGVGPFQSSVQGKGAKILFQLRRNLWKGPKLL